jgi:hypothetical protein
VAHEGPCSWIEGFAVKKLERISHGARFRRKAWQNEEAWERAVGLVQFGSRTFSIRSRGR